MKKVSYFKLMSFGPHTRLSLYMLLKQKSLFFAYKNVLNDPTDCSPYFYVEIENSELERRIKEISEDTSNEDPTTIRDAIRILDLIKEERDGPRNTAKARPSYYSFSFGFFTDEPLMDIAKKFIEYHMQLQVDEARIFSMSKKHDEPRLWAHYADSHTGVCLELEGLEPDSDSVILDRVDYTTRRPRISVSDIKGMQSSGKTKSEIFSRMFFQKSTGWDYEDEQRLVIPKMKSAKALATLSFPEGDYIKFSKLRLRSVYFGMNCERKNIAMVVSLISQFMPTNPPELFRAKQSEDNYQINFESIQTKRYASK